MYAKPGKQDFPYIFNIRVGRGMSAIIFRLFFHWFVSGSTAIAM